MAQHPRQHTFLEEMGGGRKAHTPYGQSCGNLSLACSASQSGCQKPCLAHIVLVSSAVTQQSFSHLYISFLSKLLSPDMGLEPMTLRLL